MIALSDLLVVESQQQVVDALLGKLRGRGFPIDDWNEGGVERTILEGTAQVLYDLATQAVPLVAAGGYAALAKGPWLTLLAEQLYLLERALGTFTTGTVVLTCSASGGPYTINPGDLRFLAASGNVYANTTGGTLHTSSTLAVQVQSESTNDSLATPPRNYNDGAGTITTLITALAGVTCNNPAPEFSPVSQVGDGVGTITPQEAVAMVVPPPASVLVLITLSGVIGVAQASYSVNGAAAVPFAVVASYTMIGTGIKLAFADNAGAPSFKRGETYAFTTPGTWKTAQGRDPETDPSLYTRCQARWPSLSAIPNEDVYALWAKAASVQVTRVLVETDGVVPGQVNLWLAGQAGGVGADVVATVQAYVDQRHPISDFPVAQAAAEQAIAITATVKLRAKDLPQVQVYAQAMMGALIGGTDVGGLLQLDDVADVFKQAGVKTGAKLEVVLASLRINAVFADYQLAAHDVATFTQDMSVAGITWQIVG